MEAPPACGTQKFVAFSGLKKNYKKKGLVKNKFNLRSTFKLEEPQNSVLKIFGGETIRGPRGITPQGFNVYPGEVYFPQKKPRGPPYSPSLRVSPQPPKPYPGLPQIQNGGPPFWAPREPGPKGPKFSPIWVRKKNTGFPPPLMGNLGFPWNLKMGHKNPAPKKVFWEIAPAV